MEAVNPGDHNSSLFWSCLEEKEQLAMRMLGERVRETRVRLGPDVQRGDSTCYLATKQRPEPTCRDAVL